jgi:hypothetical protein
MTDYTKSSSSIKKYRNRKIEKKRKHLLTLALIGKSDVLNLIGSGDKALQEINKGIVISKAAKDRKLHADCLLQLSKIYAAVSEYENTLSVAEKSLLMYRKIKDKQGQVTSLTVMYTVC